MARQKKCKACGDPFDAGELAPSGKCHGCERKALFAAFARECGLTRFLDPSGERYVYRLDGTCEGKKGECVDMMDELWDALAKLKGRPDMALGAGE